MKAYKNYDEQKQTDNEKALNVSHFQHQSCHDIFIIK